MKRYNKNGQLETIMCNCCGKKLVVQHGIIREGCISIDHAWDYFSEKDGQVHHLICVKNVMMNWFPASRYLWTGKNRLNFCRMG